MSIRTAAASPWPARCAYLSAAIFISASGLTNLSYGWSKGDTFATSIVWAGVAGAVAIVFALAWPALIRSVDAKRWSAAMISLVALLLSGAYSVTAALGSAAGGRANAAATETATTDARTKAQSAYDRAQAELDTLAVAKPAAEIQSLIDAAKADLAKLPATRSVAELEALMRRGCSHGVALQAQVKAPCPKYDVELARAWERKNLTSKIAELTNDIARAEQRRTEQRAKVQAAMDMASRELAAIQPARIANSDAKALTRCLGALGLEVGPDRLNDLLVLLSVLMIEAGGGLSLAIGMALSGQPGARPDVQSDTPAMETRTARTPLAATPDALPAMAEVSRTRPPVAAVETPLQPMAAAVRPAGADIVEWLRVSGGKAEGVRFLAAQLGRPRSTVSEDCHRLAATGQIAMTRGPRGIVLTLAALN